MRMRRNAKISGLYDNFLPGYNKKKKFENNDTITVVNVSVFPNYWENYEIDHKNTSSIHQLDPKFVEKKC